jgi:ribosomal-protein-alanine N-acetyltransferase
MKITKKHERRKKYKMDFREINEIDYKELEYLEAIEKESMGESFANIYTIKSIIEVGKVIVLELEGEIVGVSQLLRNMEDCKKSKLFGIYIRKKYRSRGLGEKLLQYSLSYLKKLGIEKCDLSVDPQNIKAIKMYEKNGFKVIEKKMNYYGENIHRLIMEWSIKSL